MPMALHRIFYLMEYREMRLKFITAAVLTATLAGTASAAIDEELMSAFDADCRRYAQEDGVPADQLDEYVAQCVQDMVADQAASTGEPAASGENVRQD
jgi:hypothetical protein